MDWATTSSYYKDMSEAILEQNSRVLRKKQLGPTIDIEFLFNKNKSLPNIPAVPAVPNIPPTAGIADIIPPPAEFADIIPPPLEELPPNYEEEVTKISPINVITTEIKDLDKYKKYFTPDKFESIKTLFVVRDLYRKTYKKDSDYLLPYLDNFIHSKGFPDPINIEVDDVPYINADKKIKDELIRDIRSRDENMDNKYHYMQNIINIIKTFARMTSHLPPITEKDLTSENIEITDLDDLNLTPTQKYKLGLLIHQRNEKKHKKEDISLILREILKILQEENPQSPPKYTELNENTLDIRNYENLKSQIDFMVEKVLKENKLTPNSKKYFLKFANLVLNSVNYFNNNIDLFKSDEKLTKEAIDKIKKTKDSYERQRKFEEFMKTSVEILFDKYNGKMSRHGGFGIIPINSKKKFNDFLSLSEVFAGNNNPMIIQQLKKSFKH